MNIAVKPATLSELMYGATAREIQIGSVGQEKFCRLVAAGHTIETAYAVAYDLDPKRKNCAAEALRLSRAPHIVARIMQIRAASVRGYSVKREDLLEPMLWALNTARNNHSPDLVRKVVMDLGKLFGLVIDKVEANVMGQFTIMKEVTVNGDELVFDIGSGKTLNVKGERYAERESMADIAVRQPIDATSTLEGEGGTTPLDALQNTFKTLPVQPIELDTMELGLLATLDVVGDEEQAQDVVVKGKRPATKAARARDARLRLGDDEAGDESGPYIGEDML